MFKPALLTAGAVLSLALPATAQTTYWVGTWASAQQIPEPNNALAPDDLTDATVRQIVHTSVAGAAFRVRLSNAYGTQPLTFDAVDIAMAVSPSGAATAPGTDRPVTFGGMSQVTVPAGADYVSDPIAVALPAGSDLAVSFHLASPPAQETGHPGSRATTYYVHGNHVTDSDLLGAKTVDHWYNLSGVDVASEVPASAIVAFGDSITDGHGATTNGNDRWTDGLAKRLIAAGDPVGVLNVGIGGNHILTDGLGPNALARFDRDALAQTAARYVIFFESVNDIGGLARTSPATPEAHADLVARLEAGFSRMAQTAREHGLTAIGATITPFTSSDYYHPDAATEADRQALNAWIRTPGHFDAVVDFDAVVRDPAAPDHLLSAFDCGDHLHPSPAGYAAMAAAIPLTWFEAPKAAATRIRPVAHHRR